MNVKSKKCNVTLDYIEQLVKLRYSLYSHSLVDKNSYLLMFLSLSVFLIEGDSAVARDNRYIVADIRVYQDPLISFYACNTQNTEQLIHKKAQILYLDTFWCN